LPVKTMKSGIGGDEGCMSISAIKKMGLYE